MSMSAYPIAKSRRGWLARASWLGASIMMSVAAGASAQAAEPTIEPALAEGNMFLSSPVDLAAAGYDCLLYTSPSPRD